LSAETHISQLLAAWRRTARPLVHIHHRSSAPEGLFRPGRPGYEVKPVAQPVADEPVMYKTVNSAFIGTELEPHLRKAAIDTVVIVGLTTDHCVSTTTRMAGNLGFTTYLVSDATATFERTGPEGSHFSAQLMHDTALASLSGEFCTVLDTRAAIELLG
jgi:nicotinamidase-related amidase